MAKDKKSFILYADLIHVLRKLTKEQRGDLFLLILEYVNDLNPEVTDQIIDLVFEPVKRQLKRDLVKYEITKGDKSNAGALGNLKRWNTDLYDAVIQGSETIENAIEIAKTRKASHNIAPAIKVSHPVANVAVNSTVNDTVTVNVNENENVIKSTPPLKVEKSKWQVYIEKPKLHAITDLEKFMIDNYQITWEDIQMKHKARFPELLDLFKTKNIEKSYTDKGDLQRHLVNSLMSYSKSSNGKPAVESKILNRKFGQ